MFLAGRVHTGSYALDQLLGMFFFTDSESYFPLFNWFVFPAFGMLFADILQFVNDKKRFYFLISIPCAIIAAIYYVIAIGFEQPVFTVINEWKSFSYMGLPDALAQLTVNTFIFAVFFFLTMKLKGAPASCIRFISSNINRYYCVHSVLVYFISCMMDNVYGEYFEYAAPCYITAFIIVMITTGVIILYNRYMMLGINALCDKHKYVWYTAVIVLSVAVCVWSAMGTNEFPNLVNDYLR